MSRFLVGKLRSWVETYLGYLFFLSISPFNKEIIVNCNRTLCFHLFSYDFDMLAPCEATVLTNILLVNSESVSYLVGSFGFGPIRPSSKLPNVYLCFTHKYFLSPDLNFIPHTTKGNRIFQHVTVRCISSPKPQWSLRKYEEAPPATPKKTKIRASRRWICSQRVCPSTKV